MKTFPIDGFLDSTDSTEYDGTMTTINWKECDFNIIMAIVNTSKNPLPDYLCTVTEIFRIQ